MLDLIFGILRATLIFIPVMIMLYSIRYPGHSNTAGGTSADTYATHKKLRIAQKERQTDIERDGVKISFGEYTPGEIFRDLNIKLWFENSRSKEIIVRADRMCINGMMMNFYCMFSVYPGKGISRYVSITPVMLLRETHDEIHSVELYFSAYEYGEELFKDEVMSFTTDSTSTLAEFDKGEELFSMDGLYIGIRTVTLHIYEEINIFFYMENTSEYDINITADEMFINDIPLQVYLDTTIPPGRCAAVETILDSEVKEYDIGEIYSMAITFRIICKGIYEQQFFTTAYIPSAMVMKMP